MRCNFDLNANSLHFPFVLLFAILLVLKDLASALQTIRISGDLLVTKVIARRLLVQYCILLCGQFHTATANNISHIFLHSGFSTCLQIYCQQLPDTTCQLAMKYQFSPSNR